MRRIIGILVLAVLLSPVIADTSNAANWDWEVTYDTADCPGPWHGIVYFTRNCQLMEKLWEGDFYFPLNFWFFTPSFANDILFVHYCKCGLPECSCPGYTNRALSKMAIPSYVWPLSQWTLEDLNTWVDDNVPDSMELVILQDSVPDIALYVLMDLGVSLANPPVFKESYIVTNGTCPDLPGYLIGTTEIVYDSLAPSSGYPLSTTPFSGEVKQHSKVTVRPGDPIPTLTEWGLIIFALLVMGCMAWVFVRQRRRATVSI